MCTYTYGIRIFIHTYVATNLLIKLNFLFLDADLSVKAHSGAGSDHESSSSEGE